MAAPAGNQLPGGQAVARSLPLPGVAMKYLFLLVSSCLLAATAQAQTQLTTAQLWQALRQHPQAGRQRVDLLTELADERLRMINGAGAIAMAGPRLIR